MDVEELRQRIRRSPETFYTPFLGPLKKYLQAYWKRIDEDDSFPLKSLL